MREIDSRAVREFGLTEELLMERAGMAVSSVCLEILQRTTGSSGRRILAISGGGHNGADCLVALRDLIGRGYRGEAFVTEGDPSRRSAALLREIERLRLLGVEVRYAGDDHGLKHRLTHAALLIDGLLGTGFHGTLSESLAPVVGGINLAGDAGVPVVSVDIPSGVDGLTGQVGSLAVRATVTVTFGAPKWGLLVDPGTRYAGEIRVSRIGFPRLLLEGGQGSCMTPEEALRLLPSRSPVIHKGQAGHVLLAGGSPGKAGSILLAARGSLRLGSGLVSLLWDKSLADYSAAFPEVMAHFYDPLAPKVDDVRAALDGKDSVGCGPGLPNDAAGKMVLETILSEYAGPVVADAGTFSIFAKKPKKIAALRRSRPLVLTPHPGELARLLGVGIPEVLDKPLETAMLAAQKSGAVVLLKGARTLVVDPAGNRYVNLTGHPVMAGPGMGDVLTGMIASFLGQGLDPFIASSLGAFLHGAAGARLGLECARGQFSSELADALPKVLAEWEARDMSSWEREKDPFLLVPGVSAGKSGS